MTEVLKPVTGHPMYLVSSEGRVWSERGMRWLRATPDSHGYLRVTLDGATCMVHALVAEAFLGNRGDLVIRHLDSNQRNNSLVNLQYGTQEENEADKRRRNRPKRKVSQQGPGHLIVLRAAGRL